MWSRRTARVCQRILASLDEAARHERLENRLRLILSASEPLTPEIVRSWRALLGSRVELVNMFGQTETTGVVALHRIGEADERSTATQIPVVDPMARPSPLWSANTEDLSRRAWRRLHLGGPQISCGYLNDHALTEARFRVDPSPTGPAIYRTGDLARCDADGTITLSGRIDRQVKIRGQRVEPEHVEAAIVRHAGWTGQQLSSNVIRQARRG